jgi:hypothetical protein
MSDINNTFAALNGDKVQGEGNIESSTTNVVKDEGKTVPSGNINLPKPSGNEGILTNIVSSINSLQDLEILSAVIAESSIHKGVFGKNGELSKQAVMTSLVVGASIGLTVLESLSLGKELTSDTVAKIALGNSLNIPAMIARQHIHAINNVYAVDYHIINCLMNRAGVKRKVIKDFIPVNIFRIIKSDILVEFDDNLFFVVHQGMKPEEAQANIVKGKRPVEQFATVYKTEIEFTRGSETLTFSYTTQDATEAELYKGVKSDGTKVQGKVPWNLHTKTMLRKQVVSLAKEIIADLLYGTLSTVELGYDSDVTNVEYEEVI